MTDADDSFLGRWSRRKRAAERIEDPVLPVSEPTPEPDAESEPVCLTEEELAALPRVEDLTEGSDITGFLRAGVPRALKNAALRRIWMLTPAIRDYKNPAVDYAWDWNTPGGVPGDGCAPSPERAAQMLHDLMSPRAPVPKPEPTTVDDDPTQIDPEMATKPAEIDSEHAPNAALSADAKIAEKGIESDGFLSSAPARQRHGGALPS